MLMFKHNFRFSLSVYELTMGGDLLVMSWLVFLQLMESLIRLHVPILPNKMGEYKGDIEIC